MQVSYVRMYDDADGESHFEDLVLDLARREFAPPAAPALVGGFLGTSGTLFFGAVLADQEPSTGPSSQAS